MTRDFDPSRRSLIKRAGVAGAGVIGAGLVYSGIASAALSDKTPAQTEGPFYPVKDQADKDADMTIVSGRSAIAQGTIVHLTGQVFDVDTNLPVSGALVEFWQACASGKYNHPDDPNAAPLDPNFQYWAQVRADARGVFRVKTIKPGSYPANESWVRPPHIHVKVHKQGYPSLTTQIYFKGEELNEGDQILQKLTPDGRELVVVDFKPEPGQDELFGQWNIFIGKFRGFGHSPPPRAGTPELG